MSPNGMRFVAMGSEGAASVLLTVIGLALATTTAGLPPAASGAPPGTDTVAAGPPALDVDRAITLELFYDDTMASPDGGAPPARSDLLPDEAGLGPGSVLRITFPDGNETWCTLNFLWQDRDGRTFAGTAGHCLLPRGVDATHGPDADFDAAGVRVEGRIAPCPSLGQCAHDDEGWMDLGDVVYARQDAVGTDFGLVEVPASAEPDLRLDLPLWGGPEEDAVAAAGDPIVHYGHGWLHGSTVTTRGRAGVSLGQPLEATWFAFTGTASGGDSGSPALTASAPGIGAPVEGDGAVGVITHKLVPDGVVFGTPVRAAQALLDCHVGLSIRTLPAGRFAEPESCPGLPIDIEASSTVFVEGPDALRFGVLAGEVHEVRIVANGTLEMTRWSASTDSDDFGRSMATLLVPAGDLRARLPGCEPMPDAWTWVYWPTGSANPEGPVHDPGTYRLVVASPVDATVTIEFNDDPDLEILGYGLLDTKNPEPREVPTALAEDVEATFIEVDDFERSGPAPSEVAFETDLGPGGPSVALARFDVFPFAGAGAYEMRTEVGPGSGAPCGEDRADGFLGATPTGGVTIGNGSEVQLQTLLPSRPLRWTGHWRNTAAVHDDPTAPATGFTFSDLEASMAILSLSP